MEALLTCGHCGSEIQLPAKFCGMCGTLLASVDSDASKLISNKPPSHENQHRHEEESSLNQEDAAKILTDVVNLCESNPDAGLALLEKLGTDTPSLRSFPLFRISKASAYMSKGFAPLKDRPYVKIDMAENEELLRYLNDENVNNLEIALFEIAQIENFFEDFLINASSEDDKCLGYRAEAIATVLERCRPGRVQEILGKTKLRYFGTKRISILRCKDTERMPPVLKSFLDVFFSMPKIVRSAEVCSYSENAKGRKFIRCALFEGVLDASGLVKWDSFFDYIFVERGPVEFVNFFDDGTFQTCLNIWEAWEPKENEQKKGFFKKFFG